MVYLEGEKINWVIQLSVALMVGVLWPFLLCKGDIPMRVLVALHQCFSFV